MLNEERRCVLVTGGASGIGAATAAQLAALGEMVVIVDRRIGPAREIAERLGGVAFELDIGDEQTVPGVIDAIEDACSEIECLVNCAGPFQNTDRPQDLSMRI